MPAGVGYDQRRLGGEHHKGLLVFLGELVAGFLLSQVDVPLHSSRMADRRRQEGADLKGQEVGEAQRPDVASVIADSERLP